MQSDQDDLLEEAYEQLTWDARHRKLLWRLAILGLYSSTVLYVLATILDQMPAAVDYLSHLITPFGVLMGLSMLFEKKRRRNRMRSFYWMVSVSSTALGSFTVGWILNALIQVLVT